MYRKIMVPLDGSSLAECVLPHLETIVKGCDNPEVLLVRAVEPIQIYGQMEVGIPAEQFTELEADAQNDAENYTKGIAARLEKTGITVRPVVIYGRAAEVLSDFVTNNEVDLVVIATHGRSGVSRWVRGSVADRILHSVCVPVLMVRAPGCVPGL